MNAQCPSCDSLYEPAPPVSPEEKLPENTQEGSIGHHHILIYLVLFSCCDSIKTLALKSRNFLKSCLVFLLLSLLHAHTFLEYLSVYSLWYQPYFNSGNSEELNNDSSKATAIKTQIKMLYLWVQDPGRCYVLVLSLLSEDRNILFLMLSYRVQYLPWQGKGCLTLFVFLLYPISQTLLLPIFDVTASSSC